MHEVNLETHSERETMELGEWFGSHAVNDLFLALSGDLGAGKTHFVQGLAKGMGIDGVVGSPTFAIMNYYDEGRLPLKHFDFYRLQEAEELYNIGWEEYSTGGVTVAEWADMFPDVLPKESIFIKIKNIGADKREITISWDDTAPESVTKEILRYASCH